HYSSVKWIAVGTNAPTAFVELPNDMLDGDEGRIHTQPELLERCGSHLDPKVGRLFVNHFPGEEVPGGSKLVPSCLRLRVGGCAMLLEHAPDDFDGFLG